MKHFLLFLLASLIRAQTYYSTSEGSNIINICHCDLTKDFCDYYCCCDPDCSSSITDGLKKRNLYCQNNSMMTYCLDQSYFAFINVQSTTKEAQEDGIVCYDFNSTTNDQPEVALSSKMVSSLVSQSVPETTSVTQSYYSSGYSKSVAFITTKKQLTSSGQCSTSSTTLTDTSFKFGVDTSITCTSTSSSCQAQNINLFTQFFSKTIQQFNGQLSNSSINTPSSSDINFTSNNQCLTKLTLLVFYSKLGVQANPLYYIVDTKFMPSYSSTHSTYTLAIQFINYDELVKENASGENSGTPFFPMIPKDMFYPLIYNGAEILLAGFALFLAVLN